MKKLLSLALAAAMMLSLAACGATADTTAPADDAAADTADTGSEAGSDTAEPAADTDTAAAVSYKIAIVQQLDHSSLDEIRLAVEAELDAVAAERGIEITYDEFNGQNDATVLGQIGTQVAEGGYDAVVPIATLAAQTMYNATEGTIPCVFAAISYPADADLVGLDNLTGTSDALNTPFIMDMMLAVDPDVDSVGLLYSKSEDNSATPIAEAKEYLDGKSIAYVEATGNTNDEVLTAVASLIADGVDAVFTPTDNTIMAAAAAVGEELANAGIAYYAGADSFVNEGAFATCGVNYTELGTYTADMLLDVLDSGDVPEYHVMDGGIITVNTEVAEKIEADYSAFAGMANTVVEVTTAAPDAE